MSWIFKLTLSWQTKELDKHVGENQIKKLGNQEHKSTPAQR